MSSEHIESGVFLLRHGKSRANAEGVIASQRDNGDRAGLIAYGEAQVQALADAAPFNGVPVRVLTSRYRRCIETAGLFVAAAGLHVPDGIQTTLELGERDFGALEGGSKSGYGLVYAADAQGGPDHREFGAESTGHVAERVGNLLANVIPMAESQPVILVTHADTGEIAQALTLGIAPHVHRLSVPKLRNAELRQLPAPVRR